MGVTGVESSMEEVLSSEIGTRVGEKVVEVNSLGKVVRVMSETKPTQGNNITLTIDAELQGKVEEVLANAIGTIRAEQQRIYNNNLQKYQNKEAARGGTKTRFASTGAAIVMNVNTCEVLAMASHPSFDLNLFTGGISAEDYAVLNDEETTPLFNKAISSRAEPGSIFKMLTAYAGLAEGVIDPNEQIDCLGEYSVAVTQGKAPACWQKNIIKHKGENVVTALKDSCNYYFYTVADRLGIEKLNKWASIFGLSSKTGIELESEVKSHVANQNVLYDHTKDINSGQVNSKAYLVRKAVYAQIQKYGVLLGVEYTPEQMNTAATRIVQLVGTDDDIGPGIRSILREELGISESVSYAKRWHLEISSILYEITWNRIQTVLTGIGQSVTAITPIAIARYISAIANGGTVYEATIIKRITDADGNVVMENSPKVVSTLTDTNNYFAYIKEGMREVISPEDGGTAADIFDGFEYAVDMAAKTGTAQVSSIDLENTAWFVAYTPLENTEIAVVVYIPNGYKGAMAGYAARDIIGFYRDRQKLQTDTSVTRPEGLVE